MLLLNQLARNSRALLAILGVLLTLTPPCDARTRKGDKLVKEGKLAEAQRDFDKALELFEQALAEDPMDAGYLMAVRRVRPQLCERFIFVTAHQERPRVKEFLNQVREMVLRKPFNLEDLVVLLDRLFQERVRR